MEKTGKNMKKPGKALNEARTFPGFELLSDLQFILFLDPGDFRKL